MACKIKNVHTQRLKYDRYTQTVLTNHRIGCTTVIIRASSASVQILIPADPVPIHPQCHVPHIGLIWTRSDIRSSADLDRRADFTSFSLLCTRSAEGCDVYIISSSYDISDISACITKLSVWLRMSTFYKRIWWWWWQCSSKFNNILSVLCSGS